MTRFPRPCAHSARRCLPSILALLTASLPYSVHAQAVGADDPIELDRVQVTASRAERDRHDTAASVTILQGEALDTDVPGTTLSDYVVAVPGVLARHRQNYAQDEQISIRGFGTRASFGIRSVRLYIDGIPATMPDGQGQVSHFPLADIDRIEVLRGPFSALYGNAAGGVIQVFTEDGGAPGSVGVEAVVGQYGTRRVAVDATGGLGEGGWLVGASHFHTDGWRKHSEATRNTLIAKASMPVGAGELTLLGLGFWSPDTQDPQGLTREQVAENPRQASVGALAFDIEKSVRQLQGGAVYELPIGAANALRVLAYAGNRKVDQVLSIPVFVQRSPLSAGGIIDLDSDFIGADVRWIGTYPLAGRPLELVTGLSAEVQEQARRGYENFVGTTLGVRGALRLQQDDVVRSVDPYVQATWWMAEDWLLTAGLRHSRVEFESDDRFVTGLNPDDSGRVEHSATLPVIGVTWEPRDGLSWFAAIGRGFETPTFNELGYRADGGSGLNFDLRPMLTRSVEAGVRFDGTRGARGELTVFRTETEDELAVNASEGGRTTYRNAGRAERVGVEGALLLPFADDWRLQLVGTWLDATYTDAFTGCIGVACEAPIGVIPAGTRIPGVPRTSLYAALRHGGVLGWHAHLEARHLGAIPVDYRTDVEADAFTVFGASIGYGFVGTGYQGRAFLGVDNLFDERYIGSVIINQSQGRSFEPGPDRTVFAGVEVRWHPR